MFDNTQAWSEGWCLSNLYQGKDKQKWQIQRLDDPGAVYGADGAQEPMFDGDMEALAFVTERANAGSEYHALALSLDGVIF